MAVDNRTLETKKEAKFFIIIVKRDGVKKFIDKNYFSCKHINCTVIITKAKRFNSRQVAMDFYNDMAYIEDPALCLIDIVPLKIEYSICL